MFLATFPPFNFYTAAFSLSVSRFTRTNFTTTSILSFYLHTFLLPPELLATSRPSSYLQTFDFPPPEPPSELPAVSTAFKRRSRSFDLQPFGLLQSL
jgi:hypothetical protein